MTMIDSMNRRRFFGSAAATGLALGLATQTSPAADPPASQKLVVGVMGLGGRGTGLAQTLEQQPGVEVAYVCDVDSGRAEQAAAKVTKVKERTPKGVQDFRRILDDKTVDALVVATCNHWHAPAAILRC